MKRTIIILLTLMVCMSGYAKVAPDTTRLKDISTVWDAITNKDTTVTQLLEDFEGRYGATSDFLTLKGLAYFQFGDEEAGRAVLEEALLKVTKQDRFDRENICIVLANSFDDGFEKMYYVEQALKANPKSAKAYSMRARIYYNTGFLMSEAEKDIKKAIKYDSKNLYYRGLLTRIYIIDGKNSKAAKEIKEMMKIDDSEADAYFLRSYLMKSEGNIEGYIDDYLVYLQISHDTDLEDMRDVAEEGTQYEYMMDFAGRILKSASNRESAAYWNYFIGIMKSTVGDSSCVDNYKAGLTVADDDDMRCRLMLAECDYLSDIVKYDSALVTIDSVIGIIEQSGLAAYWIYHNKANYLKKLKRYVEADSTYTKSLSCQISDSVNRSRVYYDRFDVRLFHLHDTVGALADIDSALVYNRESYMSYYCRGRLLKTLGRAAEADSDFNRVLELDTTVAFYSTRHFALAHLGRKDEAEAWLQMLLQTFDTEVAKWFMSYNAGCMYAILGDEKTAVKYLMDAMAISTINCDLLTEDEDFARIRETPEFKSVLKVSCSE